MHLDEKSLHYNNPDSTRRRQVMEVSEVESSTSEDEGSKRSVIQHL